MRRIIGSKKTGYSVLIICEGENTEPAYFESLESYIRDNYSEHYPDGISFEIFPYGPETLVIFEKEDELFSRKKTPRVIQYPEQEISGEIEDAYTAAPVRWVRYAQISSINAGYDQVWSVFDYDNRGIKHLEKSFDLAKTPTLNGINEIQIAFSSYSFEYWILLHYILYESYLAYSECKEEKESISCGTNIHPNDCNGQKCLAGRIYSLDSKVGSILKTKDSTFAFISQNIKQACIRAEYVKASQSLTTTNIWEMQPVTNMHNMLGSLIPDLGSIKWHLTPNEINFQNWRIYFLTEAKVFKVIIESNGKETIIIPKDSIGILDEMFIQTEINPRILVHDKGVHCVLDINLDKIEFTPKYISIKVDGLTNYSKLDGLFK